jgi:hypothetical protein
MLVDLAVVACPLFPLFRVVFFIRHLVHVVVPFHLFVAAATMMRRPWRMTAPANAAPSFPRAAWARGCLTPCGQPSPTRTPRLSERWTAGRPPAQALGPCAMDGTVCWFAGRCHPLPAPTPARCVWDWVCVGGGGAPGLSETRSKALSTHHRGVCLYQKAPAHRSRHAYTHARKYTGLCYMTLACSLALECLVVSRVLCFVWE